MVGVKRPVMERDTALFAVSAGSHPDPLTLPGAEPTLWIRKSSQFSLARVVVVNSIPRLAKG